MELTEINPEKYSHIKGWGIDANPKNEPTYPMKHYTGDDHERHNWDRPVKQKAEVEILRSIERPDNSAVFGTVSPPYGLSGILRRFAFKYSENMYRHWLPLILADRINVIEGLLSDVTHGHLPRLGKEAGYDALWKHKPQVMVKKIVAGAIVLGALAAIAIYSDTFKPKKKSPRSIFS